MERVNNKDHYSQISSRKINKTPTLNNDPTLKNPQKLLLAGKDEDMLDVLSYNLRGRGGYQLLSTDLGDEAIEFAKTARPNLVILDTDLKGINGYEVCKEVRANSDIPIVMISDRTEVVDKVVGLEIGADDYITKPYSVNEVLARVNAHLRRYEIYKNVSGLPKVTDFLKMGNLEVNLGTREVSLSGESVDLKAREFDLLVCLMRNSNRVLTRSQLMKLVWKSSQNQKSNTIETHIGQLRAKFKVISDESATQIETVWGIGYRMNPNPQESEH